MARPTRLLRLGSRSIESTAVVLQLHPSHEARVRQTGFQHHDSHNLPFLRECITLLPPVRPLYLLLPHLAYACMAPSGGFAEASHLRSRSL